MKKSKRILAALTACGMLCAAAAVLPVSAANTYENLTYEVMYDEYVVIKSCSTMAMSVEIPGQIDGLPVTEIGTGAFYNCTVLTEVVIPDSVLTIGNEAFKGCTLLTEVELPKGLTGIGNSAFDESALTSVTIPDSVTSMGAGLYNVFGNCDALESVTLGSGLTQIGSAFAGCDALTEVTIPANVTVLKGTFTDCVNLNTVTFAEGSNLETINGAFMGCTSLQNINLPEGLQTMHYGFKSCTGLKNIAIPDSVTYIFDAFTGCTALETVTFGERSKLEGIENAFIDCTNLKEITIPKKVTTFVADYWSGPFDNCTSLEKITFLNAYIDIPNEAASIPETAVIYCYENSTAHAYALVQGREFVIMPPPVLESGDLNDDMEINATDASMILVAATNIGADLESGLTAEQIAAADLNGDSAFNAVDASIVLQYATYVGTGGDLSIEEFIAEQA